MRDVSTVFATKLWLIASALLSQSLLARILQPEGRGAYAVCVMFGAIFPILFTPGADRGTQYHVMSKKVSLSVGIGVAFGITMLGSTLAVVLALPLFNSSLAYFQKADITSFQYSLLLMPLSVLKTVFALHLAGLKRFDCLGVLAIYESIFHVTGIAVFAWYLEGGVNGALLAMTISYLLTIALSLSDLIRNCGLRLVIITWRDIYSILDYGRRYYLARFGNMLDFHIGGFSLAFLATQSEIGLCVAATALTLRTFIVPDSIETAILPQITSHPAGHPELVAQCIRVSGVITGSILLVLVAMSEPLVRLFLSESFMPSVPIIYVLAPGIAVYAAAKIVLAYFQGTGKPHMCSYAVLMGLPITVLTTVFLYPSIGMVASAWGITISFIVRSVFLIGAFRYFTGMSFLGTVVPRRTDWAPLLQLVQKSVSRIYGSK